MKRRYVPLYYTGINYVTMPDIKTESQLDAENTALLESKMSRNKEKGTSIGSVSGAVLGLGVSALTGGAIPPTIAMGLGAQLGGLAGGLIGSNVGRKKYKNELEKNKQQIIKQQNSLIDVFRKDNEVVTNYLTKYSNQKENGMLMNNLTGYMYPVMANKGLISTDDDNLAELEKGELVFREDKSGRFKLIKDFSDAPTHDKGGVLTNLSLGDVVIPKNKREEVLRMMDRNGNIIDKFGFNSLLYSLPMNANKYRDLGNGKVIKMYGDGYGEVLKNLLSELISGNQLGISSNNSGGYELGRGSDNHSGNELGRSSGGGINELLIGSGGVGVKKSDFTNNPNNLFGKESLFSTYGYPLIGMLSNMIATLTDKSYKIGEDYAKSLLNEKAEIRDATYVKFNELQYNDRSQPLRNQLIQQSNMFNRLAQNISGGSLQNLYNMYMNNMSNRINQLQQIENQEGGRYDQINLQNVQIQNQQEQINKQLYDQNVTANEQNRARARDLRRLGLSTLYQLAAMKNKDIRTALTDNLKYLSDIQYNKKVAESENFYKNLYLNSNLKKK